MNNYSNAKITKKDNYFLVELPNSFRNDQAVHASSIESSLNGYLKGWLNDTQPASVGPTHFVLKDESGERSLSIN
jgi:hypothetical protein